MTRSAERVAAIDVGFNTILLLIAELHPTSGLVIIHEEEDQPRLGAGLSGTGRLSETAMTRALATLVRMRDACRSYGVHRIGAVATAAVRDAENGEEFVKRVRERQIPLQIVSAADEAALSYRSAVYHFPGGQRTMVADIGGGSLELVGTIRDRIKLTKSLPLGAVRLTELDLPLDALRKHIRRAVNQALIRREWAGSPMIGSGGTFVTLAAMALVRRGAESSRVHGAEITAQEVEELLAALNALSSQERRAFPGLRPERADIIVAGSAVAAELLHRLNAKSLKVNGYGVREGLLLEMTGIDKKSHPKGTEVP